MISSLPWHCAPFGDKTTSIGFTNIVSDKDEVIIATNVIKEDAEFIVNAVNVYYYHQRLRLILNEKIGKDIYNV